MLAAGRAPVPWPALGGCDTGRPEALPGRRGMVEGHVRCRVQPSAPCTARHLVLSCVSMRKRRAVSLYRKQGRPRCCFGRQVLHLRFMRRFLRRAVPHAANDVSVSCPGTQDNSLTVHLRCRHASPQPRACPCCVGVHGRTPVAGCVPCLRDRCLLSRSCCSSS